METEFLDTPNGQIIAGAHKYLSGALILTNSEEFATRPALLRAPILHLAAHGIELLLKYPLLALGATVEEVRSKYGHDLMALWAADATGFVRRLVMDGIHDEWWHAAELKDWHENFAPGPAPMLHEHLSILSRLHSRESDFALRYIAPPNTLAPKPSLLILAFGPVAEAVAKNPRLAIERWW